MTQSENAWNSSKPWMLIFTAILTWTISFVLFMIGLRFGQPIILFGNDISVFVAASISAVITMIELSLNDSLLDHDRDFIMIGLGFAAYALGISIGYVALRQIIALDDEQMEKIASISLSVIFEVAPERLMVLGLRRLNIRWSDIPRRIMSSLRSGGGSRSQQRRPQNQQPQTRQERHERMRTQQPQSQRTPRVERPAHTVGRSQPTQLSMEDIAQMIEEDMA